MQHITRRPSCTGPCLNRCGCTASYEVINRETEEYRATCPVCGDYPTWTDKMDEEDIEY